MLVIEGPDRVGKSMLAEALSIRLGQLRPGKGKPLIRHAGLELKNACASTYLPFATPWTIQDRFHLSDLCYRRVDAGLVRSPMESHAASSLVEYAIGANAGFIVLVAAAWRTYLDLLAEHWTEEELYSPALCARQNQEFWRVKDKLPDLACLAGAYIISRPGEADSNSAELEWPFAVSRKWPAENHVFVECIAQAYARLQDLLEELK